jgi:hypothetical protein
VSIDRRRNLLHRSKLGDFVSWAEACGWRQEQTAASPYEVARLTCPGAKRPIIIYRRDSGDHLTTFAAGTSLVQRWIKERNEP